MNYELIDDTFFTLVYVEHPLWSSYVYLNKRNSRLYNILNDDHASYKLNNNILRIEWDNYLAENFIKQNYNQIYIYKKI